VTSARTINLSVSDATDSDFVNTGDEGMQTVTLSSGNSVSYEVTIQFDTNGEANGGITVTVEDGTSYIPGSYECGCGGCRRR